MPTVTTDSGTVTEVLEQPKTEVKEEPKVETLAEVEKRVNAEYDKKHGRDITKLFPVSAPKPESKPESKVETKETPKTEEPKTEEKKAKGGYTRHISKLNRELGAERALRQNLETRLQALESGKPKDSTVVVDTIKEPTKPARSEFPDVEKYLEALDKYWGDVRDYDRKKLSAEVRTETGRITQAQQEAYATERWNKFVERRDEFKKTTPDFDEVIDKSEVGFEPVLQGLIIDIGVEDPGFFYNLAKNPKEAKALNKLTEKSVAVIGQSDDVAGILRYLGAHPDDIATLNGLPVVIDAKFIGILESKLAATPKEEPKTEKVAPLPAKDARQEAESKPPEQAETARRQRPEPPPKVSGSAPPPTDWKDPGDLSLAERERLFKEDPRNKRR